MNTATSLRIFAWLFLLVVLSSGAQAALVPDALESINNFFEDDVYERYAFSLDFIVFFVLLWLLYTLGVHRTFGQEATTPTVRGLAFVLALFSSMVMVMAGFSLGMLIPYRHWLIALLAILLLWWILGLFIRRPGLRFLALLILLGLLFYGITSYAGENIRTLVGLDDPGTSTQPIPGTFPGGGGIGTGASPPVLDPSTITTTRGDLFGGNLGYIIAALVGAFVIYQWAKRRRGRVSAGQVKKAQSLDKKLRDDYQEYRELVNQYCDAWSKRLARNKLLVEQGHPAHYTEDAELQQAVQTTQRLRQQMIKLESRMQQEGDALVKSQVFDKAGVEVKDGITNLVAEITHHHSKVIQYGALAQRNYYQSPPIGEIAPIQ